MKHTRLEKELIQAGKELKLIEEGKLAAIPIEALMDEMLRKHGGKRVGAGRKTDSIKSKYIRVTPEEKDFIQQIRKSKEAFRQSNKPFIINIPALTKNQELSVQL